MYLVGGLRGADSAAEVWRYDLDGDDWAHVLQPGNDAGADDADPPSEPRAAPGKILALGYHDLSAKLVAVDERAGVAKPGIGPKIARLLVFDLRTNMSRVALTLPRVGTFDDVRLAARETGTFVLVGVQRNAKKWDAFEFSVNATGQIQWLGRATGFGLVLDEPVNTSDGLFLPVASGGVHTFVPLSEKIFVKWPAGCTKL